MRKLIYWLSLGLVFTIPFENLLVLPGVGSLGRMAGVLVMAFWAFYTAVTRGLRQPDAFHGAVLLFVLWNGFSVIWSIDTGATLTRFLTYAQLFGLVYIVWDLYTTRPALFSAFQAYVLGCYVAVADLLQNWAAGAALGAQRFSATGFNANDLALILALGMPLAWQLATSAPAFRAARLLRVVNFAFLPAACFAILLTGSRAGFLAMLPAFALVLASLPRLRLQSVLVLGIAAALLGTALLPLVPERSIERLANTSREVKQGDWNQRLVIWRESLSSIAAHPFLGVGSNAHRAAAVETQKVAHNLVLSLLAEVGLVGFLLFLLLFLMAALRVWTLPAQASRMWLALLVIWGLSGATHNVEHRKQTWLFLSLAVAAASLPRQEEEGEGAATRVVSGAPRPAAAWSGLVASLVRRPPAAEPHPRERIT